MASEFCNKCGAAITEVKANFCSKCGSDLQSKISQQSIIDNIGDALNINMGGGVLHGGIKFGDNISTNPYKFPPLDLSPTFLSGGKANVNELIKIFSITGILGLMSFLFTIFGKNIFDIAKFFTFSDVTPQLWNSWWFIVSIVVVIFSCFYLAQAVLLRRWKFLKVFDTYLVELNGKMYFINFRRICPYSHCGGVMELKRTSLKEDKTRNEKVWVCKKNPDLHQAVYDKTQIDRAIEDGNLSFLFSKLSS